MPGKPSFKEQIEGLLTCSVCQDVFNDPLQLICGHSFCNGCIDRLISHPCEDSVVKCPICRDRSERVLYVYKTLTLISIVDHFKNAPEDMKDRLRVLLTCSVCQDIFDDPHQLPCGHSFCKRCLGRQAELLVNQIYGCPKCRAIGVLPKPSWYKTFALNDIVEIFRCALEENSEPETVHHLSVRNPVNIRNIHEHRQTIQRLSQDITDNIQTEILRDRYEHRETVQRLSQNTTDNVQPQGTSYILTVFVNFMAITMGIIMAITILFVFYFFLIYSVMPALDAILNVCPLRGIKCSLDMDTVNPFLRVNSQQTSAVRFLHEQDYPYHPSRFSHVPQALTTECISSGKHTWSVRARGYWDLGMAYKNISRKGSYGVRLGSNAESWGIRHKEWGDILGLHNNKGTVVQTKLVSDIPHTIEVAVDFEQGTIKFVRRGVWTETLYDFKASFKQPICLGFGLYSVAPPSSVSIYRISGE